MPTTHDAPVVVMTGRMLGDLDFGGVSDPYDTPTAADRTFDTSIVSIEEDTDLVRRFLAGGGWPLGRSS